MADYTDLELQRLLEHAYGIGASDMAAIPTAPDPRVNELYEAWQMEQYDASIEKIVNDPANADINPNRLHYYVASADGDFDMALELYRADTAQVLADYGQTPGAAPLPGETPGYAPDPNVAPRDNLHRAIEEATRASLARRGR